MMKCIRTKLRFRRALETDDNDVCGVENNLTPAKHLASNDCIKFLMKYQIKTTLIIPISACYYSKLWLCSAILSYLGV